MEFWLFPLDCLLVRGPVFVPTSSLALTQCHSRFDIHTASGQLRRARDFTMGSPNNNTPNPIRRPGLHNIYKRGNLQMGAAIQALNSLSAPCHAAPQSSKMGVFLRLGSTLIDSTRIQCYGASRYLKLIFWSLNAPWLPAILSSPLHLTRLSRL